jgi:hypothetical protein
MIRRVKVSGLNVRPHMRSVCSRSTLRTNNSPQVRRNLVSDYRVEAATKEEWAERAFRAEEKVAKLQEELKWLEALEAAGVDNWSGIEYAHELMREFEDEV